MDLSLNSGWADKIGKVWGTNQISANSWLSVSDMIKQEEAAEQESGKVKLSDFFNKRSAARKAISSWEITSWNKAQDVMETRMWKLVDLYLDAASREVDENWKQVFSTEKIIEASKNPSKVIKDMKKYYIYNRPDKAWAIDDYIQKWWKRLFLKKQCFVKKWHFLKGLRRLSVRASWFLNLIFIIIRMLLIRVMLI